MRGVTQETSNEMGRGGGGQTLDTIQRSDIRSGKGGHYLEAE